MNPQNELDLIRKILEKVNTPMTAEEILSFALQGIKDAFNCLACSIIIIDPPRDHFKVVISKGWSNEFVKRFHGRSLSGFLEDALKLKEPLRVDGTSTHFQKDSYVFEHPYRVLLAVPMAIRGKRIGVLYLSSSDDDAFRAGQQAMLRDMANLCTLILDHGGLGDQVTALSQYDPKTGMFGYQFWHEQLHREIVKTEKVDLDLSLMDIRMNKFKEYNSMNGHVKGDLLLNEASKIIQNRLCELDVPCRVGSKWHVLLVGENRDAAGKMAENILQDFEKFALDTEPRVSISIGLSSFIKGEAEKALIQRVDNALSEARRKGGNSLHVQ
ncbi:MAG: GGDEF domain-containing protein [bacterium]|nr:MAG: GGDEF domain-containing protein [bacterium]